MIFTFLPLVTKYDNMIVYIVLGLSIFAIILVFIHKYKESNKIEEEAQKFYQNKKTNQFRNLPNDYKSSKLNINLKLQAYERLTIFLSRIDPWRLLSLINITEKDIKVIEDFLLQIIISEFEYNLSQQVYVSDNLWELIESSKEKTINLILSVKTSLRKNDTGQDFYNSLEKILKDQNTTPSKITLAYLKKEVRSI
tara:strand:+ start:224 stop:811 length:588 start_codon:yes stop_codon:yes gene_type:complete